MPQGPAARPGEALSRMNSGLSSVAHPAAVAVAVASGVERGRMRARMRFCIYSAYILHTLHILRK